MGRGFVFGKRPVAVVEGLDVVDLAVDAADLDLGQDQGQGQDHIQNPDPDLGLVKEVIEIGPDRVPHQMVPARDLVPRTRMISEMVTGQGLEHHGHGPALGHIHDLNLVPEVEAIRRCHC